jgi:hypothetical protein
MSYVTIPPIVEVSQLGVLSDTPDFKPAGESLGVWRTPSFPGYLFKRYNADASKKVNSSILDRLVQQPHVLSDPAEAAFLAASTSWPVSRITEHQRTVGVMMPEAPPSMSVSWLRRSFTNPTTEHSPLPIDYLAKDNTWLAIRGIPRQSAADREALCSSLVRVACFLEQCGLVYADWSYANAFWQPYEHTVYVFDLDGCSYGPRAHVFTSEFEDPLTPDPDPVDTYTDRFRVALLVGRILTESRSQPEVKVALGRMTGRVPRTLLDMLTGAGDRTARPSLTQLALDLGAPVPQIQPSDPTGVNGWRGRGGHTPPKRPNNAPSPPTAPGWRPRRDYKGGRPVNPAPGNGGSHGGPVLPSQPVGGTRATGSYPVINTPPAPPPVTRPARPPVPTPTTDVDWATNILGGFVIAVVLGVILLFAYLIF